MLTGEGWIVPEHHPPERLRAGETIIVRDPGTFTFVNEPDTRAEPVACGEFCATPSRAGRDTGAGGATTATARRR